jgi:hypothetical protein
MVIIEKIINWVISLDPINGGDIFPQGTGCFIGCQIVFWGALLIVVGFFIGKII